MTEPGGDPIPTEGWKAVTPEPSEGSTAPMPRWVKPALAGGITVLLAAGGLIGAALGSAGPGMEEPPVEESPSPTVVGPAFELEPPVVVGELVRGQVSESTGPAPVNQEIVQADYTDGTDTVVFVLTWPEVEISGFLSTAGIGSAQETAEGSGRYCGVSEDTGQSACGQVLDEVGMLLVSVSEQSEDDVAATLMRFQREMGQ